MKINNEIKHLEREIKHDFDEAIEYIKEPPHIKMIKILTILIIIGVFGYIIYNNLIVSHEYNYFYDIGGEEDAKKPYLTPIDRVSDIIIEEGINYRNQKKQLSYFEIPIKKKYEVIKIQTKLKENFPKDGKFLIGIKEGPGWDYKFNEAYNFEIDSSIKDEWILVKTSFDIIGDDAYITSRGAIIAFNVPHLAPSEIKTNTQYLPIDWIEITVYKSGIIEKIKEGTPFFQALKEVMGIK
jgi:hypothetical protein